MTGDTVEIIDTLSNLARSVSSAVLLKTGAKNKSLVWIEDIEETATLTKFFGGPRGPQENGPFVFFGDVVRCSCMYECNNI